MNTMPNPVKSTKALIASSSSYEILSICTELKANCASSLACSISARRPSQSIPSVISVRRKSVGLLWTKYKRMICCARFLVLTMCIGRRIGSSSAEIMDLNAQCCFFNFVLSHCWVCWSLEFDMFLGGGATR